jgi:hypothetical protein
MQTVRLNDNVVGRTKLGNTQGVIGVVCVGLKLMS